MKAAILTEPRSVVVRELDTPEPGRGQVRVRLQGCGVCASNLPTYEGREWFRYPMPPGSPGHEGWGVVEELGPDVNFVEVGERVAFLSDRAYATHDVAAADQLIRIPASLGDAPFPGEALACAWNVVRRAELAAEQTVAVVGVGFLGALVTAIARRAGARVLAISRRESSLALARRYGAEKTISMHDPQAVIREALEWTDGLGCDRVIEAVGNQRALDLATQLTRIRGRLVVAGYHQDGPRQVDLQLWNWRGLDVINAHERDPRVVLQGMRAALQAVREGTLDPAPLYTHSFPLAELERALEITGDRPAGFVKALIRFDH